MNEASRSVQTSNLFIYTDNSKTREKLMKMTINFPHN